LDYLFPFLLTTDACSLSIHFDLISSITTREGRDPSLNEDTIKRSLKTYLLIASY